MNKLLKKKWIKCLFLLISCAYILSYFHVATTFDEKYTLLLVNHSFLHLIVLDSLDVHPPLYYIILRYFLLITTFWTNSIVIKIIFSRILSLLFSVVTYIYVYKIFKLYKVKVNLIYLWILFISLPNVLGSYDPYMTAPLVDIRMYSLAAMFISMELYYLSKLKDNNNIIYIIITILMIFSFYTHYFSAIISVMMIITFIIRNLLYKEYKISRKLIKSLIISFVAFLPWIPFLFKQISIPKTETFNVGRLGTLIGIFKFIILCLLLCYPIYWGKKHLNHEVNKLSINVISTMSLTMLFVSTILLLVRPMFNLRYIYPIFLLYELYSLNIVFSYMKSHTYITKIYMYVIIILMFISCTWSAYYQIYNVDLPDININKHVNKIIHNNNRVIRLNPKYSRAQINPKVMGYNHQYNIDETPINFEYAFLFSNKNIYIKAPALQNYFGINYKPAYKPIFKHIRNHIH